MACAIGASISHSRPRSLATGLVAAYLNDVGARLMKVKFLAILLLVGVSQAQERLVARDQVPDAPSTRRFWSAENKIDLSIFAGQLAADAITTQQGLSEGFREVNPLLRPLVTRGVAGQGTASALSFGAGLGTGYLLHVTHHYRAERLTLRLILAGEGALEIGRASCRER